MAIFILPKTDQVKIELGRIDFGGILLFIITMIGLILSFYLWNQLFAGGH